MTVEEIGCLLDDPASERTLYRDLKDLAAAGFAVESDKGRWRVPREAMATLPVSPSMVVAVGTAARLLAPLGGAWLHGALRDLQNRLTVRLTAQGRAWCEVVLRASVAQLTAPVRMGEAGPVSDAIQEAYDKEHVLRIVYQKPGEEPEARDVEPRAIWYQNGALYMVAFCRKAQELRTFHVRRILQATVLDEACTTDPTFDAARFAQRGFGAYHGQVHRVVVDLSPDVAYLSQEREYHATQVTEVLGGGWVRLSMEAAGLPEIASWVASFGGKAVPREPIELVEAVRAKHLGGLAALDGELT